MYHAEIQTNGRVVEQVDARDLKFLGENHMGSIPITPTILGIGVMVAQQTLTL